jgi:hypothetical protein
VRRIGVVVALVFVLVGALLAWPSVAKAPAAPPVVVRVLSNRADLVSGGDALVEVVPAASSVTLNGADVTGQFAVRPNGRYEALLTGLRNGRNVVVARVADGRGAQLTITNAPIGGPVFAGPQIQPWTCQAGAQDKQCNQPVRYSLMYLPTGMEGAGFSVAGFGGASPFKPYDPNDPPPPGSIATTTTQTGVTMPFIVRVETGYLARDQYKIAALVDPSKPWTAWAPQPQFNHKLVITHGASCDTEYHTASAPDVMDAKVLGAGFVVMSHALDNAGHNCNIITQAESLVMTKERVIEQYGELRYTIGSGCSGGSLVQQQVANAYPGLYQGISPQCSFTDAWSSAMQYVDYYGLLKYFEDPSRWDPGTVWDPVAISEVLDHPNIGNPITFTTVIPNSSNPSRSCPGVPDDKVYHPDTNPGGVKCTLQDYMVNVFGKRPDGFANRAFGNVGIQYGLNGLLKGLVSAKQFVDLNTNGGGLDYNGNLQPERSAPDIDGLRRAYLSGAVDSANNLDKVAIIDLRGPDPGAFHDVYRTYAMRARLLRNFGTADNQVLWRGQSPIIGDTTFADAAIFALDKWLARVEADGRSSVPLARKIIEDKPDDVVARCTDGFGTDVPAEVCDQTVAAYGTPRMAAGGPLADDTLQCQLKPMRREDYGSVTFTDEQWARLQKAFPTGVCDWSKPGVEQRGALAWQTYQDANGGVIYGGTPLPPAPVSVPLRRR